MSDQTGAWSRQARLLRIRLIVSLVVAVVLLAVLIPQTVQRHRRLEAQQLRQRCQDYARTLGPLALPIAHPECAPAAAQH